MTSFRSREPELSRDAESLMGAALSDVREEVIQSAMRMYPTVGNRKVDAQAIKSALEVLGVGRFRSQKHIFSGSRLGQVLIACALTALMLMTLAIAWFVGGGDDLDFGSVSIGFVSGAIGTTLAYVFTRKAASGGGPHQLPPGRFDLEALLLKEWIAVEKLMRETVDQSLGAEWGRSPVSSIYSKYLEVLNATEVERESFDELRRLRNAIVHGAAESISDEDLLQGIKRAKGLINAIEGRQR